MEKLFTTYSVEDIILFIVMLAGAIKIVVDFLQWGRKKVKDAVHKDDSIQTIDQKIAKEDLKRKKDKQAIEQQIIQMRQQHRQSMKEMQNIIDKIDAEMQVIQSKTDLLIQSDRDDIKAWITQEYHYFVNQLHKIDNYSLDCIERRYSHYVEEHGNSFVEDLMKQIRALPKITVSNIKIEDISR